MLTIVNHQVLSQSQLGYGGRQRWLDNLILRLLSSCWYHSIGCVAVGLHPLTIMRLWSVFLMCMCRRIIYFRLHF